jgi:hypothetical protein
MAKRETFTAEPPCPGCSKLLDLADTIKKEYGDKLEVVKHIGPCEEFDKYGLTVVPAVVVDGGIKITGVCPSVLPSFQTQPFIRWSDKKNSSKSTGGENVASI